MAVARRRGANAKTQSRDSLTIAGQRTVEYRITRSTASSTIPSFLGGMLGMVHAILGIRARPDRADGRIPTVACGMTGSVPARGEQRVASGMLAHRPGFFGRGTLRLHRCASLQHQGAR